MKFRALGLAAAAAVVATLGNGVGFASDRIENATGIVEKFSASNHEIVVKTETGETRSFAWTRETKFSGVVTDGARVSLRYTKGADATATAKAISVIR